MKMFEDEEFNGPLGEYLENCKPYRAEAIYNKKYKYIKEIIWDTEAQEKFGSTRKGYEQFQQDENYPGGMSYSGCIDLRVRYDNETMKPLGYITESKRTSNDNYKHMKKQYEDAREKLFELLEVKDREMFDYWLEGEIPFRISSGGANELIESIKRLERLFIKYNSPEEIEFKNFVDKIKG